MKPSSTSPRAFTLIELSIVVLVLALLAAAAMRYANAQNEAGAIAATNATLDAVETALLNFENAYGRLPCPADITALENAATFGTETDSTGDGACSGYNFINSATDPDAAGGSSNNYGGAADPLYTSANTGYPNQTVSQVVEGAIPTLALRLPDRYAYDAWGNKIFYAVDIRMTQSGAFALFSVTSSVVGAIVVKSIANSSGSFTTSAFAGTLASADTTNGIYALLSAGKNGHGAYARNLTSTSVTVNAGSSNWDELNNCHCDSTGNNASSNFNRIFVQKAKTIDSTSSSDNFDDIVRFKTRANAGYSGDLQ